MATAYRGRVMAAFGVALQSMSISWLLGGWLIDAIDIFPTVLVAVGGRLDRVGNRLDRVERATVFLGTYLG